MITVCTDSDNQHLRRISLTHTKSQTSNVIIDYRLQLPVLYLLMEIGLQIWTFGGGWGGGEREREQDAT